MSEVPLRHYKPVPTAESAEESPLPDVLVDWSVLGGKYSPPDPNRIAVIEAQPIEIRFVELPFYAIELTGKIRSVPVMLEELADLKVASLPFEELEKGYAKINQEFQLNRGVRALIEIAHKYAALYSQDQIEAVRKATEKYDKANVLHEIGSMYNQSFITPGLRRSSDLTLRTIMAWQKGIRLKEPSPPLSSVQ